MLPGRPARTLRTLLCVGAWGACAFRAPAACAEQPVAQSVIAAEPTAAATQDTAPGDSANLDAAAAYRQAEAAYEAGDLEAALRFMQRAYQVSGRAELEFNLGELERELGHCAAARTHYDAYLATVVNGTFRERAAERSAELAGSCPPATPTANAAATSGPMQPQVPIAFIPAPAPLPADAPVQPRDTPSYFTPLRVTGLAVLGGSVAVGSAAAYFAMVASRDSSRLEAHVASARANGGGVYASDQELEQQGRRAATAAGVLGVSALVLVGGGIALLAWPEPSPAREHAELDFSASPAGAAATLHGRF